MSEFENVMPYTQAELDQQEIWAKEFDQWWESEGQYHRTGGNDYCRTFAWFAWLSREQSKQSEIDQLKAEKEKLEIELTRTKQVLNNVIDMERNKVDQLKAQLIEQGQWFNDQSQKVKDLEHWNLKLKAEKAGLEKRVENALNEIFRCRVIGADRIHTCDVVEKALRGGHE